MKRLDRLSHSLSIARRFVSGLRPHRLGLLRLAALSLVIAGLDLLKPWPLQWIFDGALAPVAETGLSFGTVVWTGVAAVIGIALLRSGLQYVREIGLARIGHAFTRGLRARIFSHLAYLSPVFHARHKSGDLLVRLMGDVPMVSRMMVTSSMELGTRSILIVGTVVVMVVLDPLLTMSVLAALPLLLAVVRWVSGRIRIAVRKQRRKEGDLADYMHEAIAATSTIQSLGGSDHVVKRFARTNRRMARAGLKAKRLAARLSASVEILLGVALAGVLALGSFRVAAEQLTPGELLVFVAYVRSLLKPLRSASRHAERIAKGTACGERILSILDEKADVRSAPGASAAPARPAELSFRSVWFGYEEGSPVLQGFSADFRQGELTALVGRNGAGKSTVALLASRLFDPHRGAICIDGRPLESVELGSLRERIALCMQRTVLFGDSLRENLLLGRPDASDEELEGALREADALELVEDSPDGLDTRLGANGVGLSGGQQSRLSLARTLLRGAPVLILDEPFTGLDASAVERVGRTLRRLAADRIVVVIAHDAGNLGIYDRIVFVDGGQVVSDGTHSELFARHPLYRTVVRATEEVSA